MTTEVEIKNIQGPDNIRVSIIDKFGEILNNTNFTILQPEESIKLYVYDTQSLLITEAET